ncbi:MAG: hypothetical protein K2X03_16075 [Bryobacteraceae bacterium]|nr:hypothetical protein [Bryobacteraceae bacterium]
MKMTCQKIALAMLAVAIVSPVGDARPGAPLIFCATYPEAAACQGGRVAACTACHTSLPVLNAYGRSVSRNLPEGVLEQVLVRALAAVEPLDSDGDGLSNLMEIRRRYVSGRSALAVPAEGGREVSRSRSVVYLQAHVRTIMKTVAQQHGGGMLLPVASMSTGGFLFPGSDPGLSARLAPVSVQDPATFPVSLHGSFGLPNPVPETLLSRARQARRRADSLSVFERDHLGTDTLRKYIELQERFAGIECGGLMPQLLLRQLPGLIAAPEVARMRQYLPSIDIDIFEAQAALAFLLVKNGHSSAVAIGPNNSQTTELVDGQKTTQIYPTMTFDSSHTGHRAGQSASWSRTFRVADSLIRLLKETEDPRYSGKSMWANSLVYFATDFGRDKTRPAGSLTFGTGHDLNNGTILVSPLLKGNRVYGGVDPDTRQTYGFDRATGAPVPGSHMDEQDVFGAICQALAVPFEGRRNVDCMMK